jgi:DNA-binding MarR family transcriptional regulator
MQNKKGQETQRVLDAIRRVVRELRVSARRAESHVGLSAAQLFVLQHLSGAETLSMGQLAERTCTDPSSVSVVVKKLVEQNYVKRARSSVDERRVEVMLTKRGRSLLERAPDVAQQQLIEALGAMPATRRRMLAQLLDEVVERMGLAGDAEPLPLDDEGTSGKAPRQSAR